MLEPGTVPEPDETACSAGTPAEPDPEHRDDIDPAPAPVPDPPAGPASPVDLDRLRPVYQEVHERLWQAILGWSGSADVADEAVAEAFAQAARRGDALRDPAAWVWRAAFRIAAGDLAARRRTDHLDPDVAARRPAPDPVLPGDLDDLLDALQLLSDQQRRVIVLIDGAGFSGAEAAALLGTSVSTVRVQTLRARRRLRAVLAPQEDPHAD